LKTLLTNEQQVGSRKIQLINEATNEATFYQETPRKYQTSICPDALRINYLGTECHTATTTWQQKRQNGTGNLAAAAAPSHQQGTLNAEVATWREQLGYVLIFKRIREAACQGVASKIETFNNTNED